MVAVAVPQRRGDDIVVDRDEEFTNVRLDKIPTLRPAFDREGTVTAANASTLNDGASALVLAMKRQSLNTDQPLAKILAIADVAQAPEWFTTAPSLALPKRCPAGLSNGDIDLWESTRRSVWSACCQPRAPLDPEVVNVHGECGTGPPWFEWFPSW